MKLTTKKWGEEISWEMGSCTGSGYDRNQQYSSQCCLAPGDYTLTCKDSYGDGWHGGFMEIQGNKYCKDFKAGSSATVTVTI